MALYGDNNETLANALNLSPQRLSAKKNNTNGAEFTQTEIQIIKERYNLTDAEVVEIFLSQMYLKRYKRKKVNKMICFISFMMMLGIVGALENDAIGFKEAIIKSIFWLIIFGISSIRYWNKEDKRLLKRRITNFFKLFVS